MFKIITDILKGVIFMIKNVTLPVYSKTEEILNTISHGLGVPLGILSLVLCLLKAMTINAVIGSVLFSVSMIILYSSSTVYHGLKRGNAKKVMRLIDHSVIFLLISGTSISITVICVYPYLPVLATVMTSISVILSTVGIILTFIDHEKYKKVQMTLYMVVGWISLVLIYPIAKYCPQPAKILGLIVAGGVIYTVGTIFYAFGKKKKYFHSIFHFFVLAGSILHFLAIYFVV